MPVRERERLSRKRCLFLMKKSRTLPSRFYQASLPPVVLYCGTVPLCFAVQITVSPHSTHTIKEKEKERTKIWKPRPSISFFFFFGPYLYCGSSDLLLTLRLTFYIDGKNFLWPCKENNFVFSYFTDEREAEPEFQVRRASPRPSSVQRKRFSPALTAAHSISKVRLSLSLFFWLEINRVKRISTFSSSPSHLSVECLRGIKRRDYHQVRRRLYTHHTHDGVIGQGLIKASVTPALRAPQRRICQCVNHGKGDWIIYCCCSFQNPPLLCLVWRTFHLIIYRLFAEWWRWLQTSSWRTNGSESITPTATRAARRPFSSSSSR